MLYDNLSRNSSTDPFWSDPPLQCIDTRQYSTIDRGMVVFVPHRKTYYVLPNGVKTKKEIIILILARDFLFW